MCSGNHKTGSSPKINGDNHLQKFTYVAGTLLISNSVFSETRYTNVTDNQNITSIRIRSHFELIKINFTVAGIFTNAKSAKRLVSVIVHDQTCSEFTIHSVSAEIVFKDLVLC